MTKKVKVSFLILVWGVVGIQSLCNFQNLLEKKKLDANEQKVTAFLVTNPNKAQNEIRTQGFFGSMELSEQMKEDMLKNLARKIGISNTWKVERKKEKGRNQTVLFCENQTCELELKIVSIVKNRQSRQYILLKMKAKTGDFDAQSIHNKVDKIFREIGVEPTFYLQTNSGENRKK